MKTILMLMMALALAGCGPSEKEVAAKHEAEHEARLQAIIELDLASWSLTLARDAATETDASPADGVDYADAKRKMEAARKLAAEAGISKIAMQAAVENGASRAKQHLAFVRNPSGQ